MSTPEEELGTNLVPDVYYRVVAMCPNPECRIYQEQREYPQKYSNGGDITDAIWCGISNNYFQILECELLDPQPIPE